MKQENLNFWHIPLGMIFAIVVILMMMCSCKSIEYVPVAQEHTLHDSIYFTQIQRDSIWQHDSVFIKDRGDTMLIERWHTKYVESIKHDTTFVAKIDSIPVPYEVKVEVPAELSWWQQTRMRLGEALMLILSGLAAFGLWRIYRRLKP